MTERQKDPSFQRLLWEYNRERQTHERDLEHQPMPTLIYRVAEVISNFSNQML